MKHNFDISQGGSVAGFLIVGFVLVVLSVGGVYLVQQRDGGEVLESPKPVVTSTDKKTENKKSKPAPAREASRADAHDRSTLPETGPADGLWIIFISFVITGFSVAYIQSIWSRLALVRR